MTRLLAALCCCVLLEACSGSSSPAPTPTPTPAPAATFTLSGGVTLGTATGPGIAGATVSIVDGQDANKSATADSNGRYVLEGIRAGGFTVVANAPTFVQNGRGITFTASTVANFVLLPVQIWSMTGRGNTTFDVPAWITRARVQVTTRTACESFTMRFTGPGAAVPISAVLGTCAIASGTSYDNTVAISGPGTVVIEGTGGIDWTFTEVR